MRGRDHVLLLPDPVEGFSVEQEVRGDTSSPELQHSMDFGEIAHYTGRKHMSEHARQEHQVKCPVFKGKGIVLGAQSAGRVVMGTIKVGDLKVEVGKPGVGLPAPLDSIRHHIETFVSIRKISRQGSRLLPNAAPYIQHRLMWTELGMTYQEVVDEVFPD